MTDVRTVFVTFLVASVSLSGCLSGEADTSPTDLRLATTTSMRDSGLLDVLLDEFTTMTNYSVEYVAVGTGAALQLGEQGDVDALIVHAPDLETSFIEAGHGTQRTQVAWNAFVVLSPSMNAASLDEAFVDIFHNERCFVSRGDFSGTHEKEQAIWRRLAATHDLELIEDHNGLHPAGDWYFSIGQGMGAAINMADEKQCSTLSDWGTALNFQSQISLNRYTFNDSLLYNPYSYIPVSGMDHPAVDALQNYLLSEGRQTIASFTIDGEAAFFLPDQP